MSFKVTAVTTPDDKDAPLVVYLTPVDAHGRKTGAAIVGTLSRSRAGQAPLGAVLKATPRLGKYTPPAKRPESVEE